MRIRRVLTAATLAVLAATTLSACQTKVGQAAAVNGATLSDNDVASYLQPGSGPYTNQGGVRIVPKQLILTTWIRTQLLNAAIAAKGGEATSAELRAANAAVEAGNSIETAEQTYNKYGYTNKFGDLLFDQTVRIVVLIERLAKTSNANQALQLLSSGQANNAIGNAIVATKLPVELSARYGKWDPDTIAISDKSGSGAPSFITFGG